MLQIQTWNFRRPVCLLKHPNMTKPWTSNLVVHSKPNRYLSNSSFLSGRPTPRVTWWRDHALLDDVSEVVDEAAGKVTNELRLVQLRRTDLHSILTCQASNNNISVPASTSVKLDMHCKFFVGVVVIQKNNSTYFFPNRLLFLDRLFPVKHILSICLTKYLTY